MVKEIKVFRGIELVAIPIEQYLEQYHSKPAESWDEILENSVHKSFNIKNDDDYNAFLKSDWLVSFDYVEMRNFYNTIKIELGFLDDDILKYIAYIAMRDYFKQIGNPSWYVWLNAKNINEPFKKYNDDEGFSIVDIMGLKYGTNAIKRILLSAFRVIHGYFA
ncbi:hypothetical protein FACS1894182_11810 [Bacteroidia bacterium]|nr:hypothetical protein FACS1894182_11810 [Bacteroidia bacterium]